MSSSRGSGHGGSSVREPESGATDAEHGMPDPGVTRSADTPPAPCALADRLPGARLDSSGSGPPATQRSFVRRPSPGGPKSTNVPALPWGFDRAWVIPGANERDSIPRRYAIEHRHTSKCRAGPPASAGTGNLHPLVDGAAPSLRNRGVGVLAVDRQSEVRPAQPSGRPGHRSWVLAQQVHPELGLQASVKASPEAAPAHSPTTRQGQHTLVVSCPRSHPHHPTSRHLTLVGALLRPPRYG